MSDDQKAVAESSPDQKDVITTKVVEDTDVKTNEQEEDASLKEEQKPQEESQEDKPVEKEKKVDKRKARTEKRFQKLIGKLKEKNQPQELPKPTAPKQVNVEYADDGTPVVDPEQLVQVAEDRAFSRLQREQMLKEYNARTTEFEKDLIEVASKVGDNKVLEKLATRIFNNENYVFDPVSGNKMFVPNKPMSQIVSELEETLGDVKTEAQADMNSELKKNAETATIQPGVSNTPKQSSDYEDIQKAKLSNSDADWNAIIKRRLFGE